MGVYTRVITPQPQQVYQAGQFDALSLSNNGPTTLYLASNSAVNTASGVPLPPTGTIEWDPGDEVWVLCGAGLQGQITVSTTSGNASVNRAKFWQQLLYTNGIRGQTSATLPTFECAHCETLEVLLQINYGNTLRLPPPVTTFTITWMDIVGNVIFTEGPIEVMALTALTKMQIVARIPVGGSIASVAIQQFGDGTVTPTFIDCAVYGTDLKLSPCSYSTFSNNIPIMAAAAVSAINTSSSDAVTIVTPGANITEDIFIASMGQWVVYSASLGSLTAAGYRNVRIQADATPILTTPQITASGAPMQVIGPVPWRKALKLGNSGGLAGTGNLVQAVGWQQYYG